MRVPLFVLVELAPSTVSATWRFCGRRGWWRCARGRWVYYRLAGREAPEPARSALAWLRGVWAMIPSSPGPPAWPAF
ncbi:hypothetical protein HS125_19835 [bacterium]|nr:hypothetical protein [bacterium]